MECEFENIVVEYPIEIKKGFRLAVIGCGYVGLPTAALFADAGLYVTAVDVRRSLIEVVNKGKSPINEPALEEIIFRNVKIGKLRALPLSDLIIPNMDALIITVQTPIDVSNKPDLSFLNKALEIVGKNLRKKMLIVVCSTIPPGTMQTRVKPLLESSSSLKAESDFYLAYVPERIAPGKALHELAENIRLVGGIGPESTKRAVSLFKAICKRIIETDATTAEIAKVAENTFRDVNIAFANQLALICEQHGADVTKVISLANTHPRVNIHSPGPGVGGPCLTKDPYLLISEANHKSSILVKTARKINDQMPNHIVDLITDALIKAGKKIESSQIAILGVSYKADVDDSRFSPSEPIIRRLIALGAEVTAFDPYCLEAFGAKKATSLFKSVKGADCVAIITNHREFSGLQLHDLKKLMNVDPAIIDAKRIIDPLDAKAFGFAYYGVGCNNKRLSGRKPKESNI